MKHIEIDAQAMEIKALLICYVDELRLAQPSSKWFTKALAVKVGTIGIEELINDLKVDYENNHKRKEVVQMLSKVEQWINSTSTLVVNQQKEIDSLNGRLNEL